MMDRRTFILQSSALAAFGGLGGRDDAFSIGACDWSLGRRADIGSLARAAMIGLDGVQVSLGTVENDMNLRRPAVQRAYLREAERLGVRIGGVAIGALNQVPYKSDPRTVAWVADSIDVAQAMGVDVVLLAFFSQGDLKGDAEGQAEVVRRLRAVAPKAEASGVVLGIESWLSADEHLALLDAVGSPNVRVYYDTANAHRMGYDIYSEIRQLGVERICEFHLKENGALLGQGVIDFRRVREAIDAIGYRGWLQIEGATPEGMAIVPAYEQNLAHVRALF